MLVYFNIVYFYLNKIIYSFDCVRLILSFCGSHLGKSRVQISARRQVILRFFMVFLSSCMQMPGWYLKLCHDRFITHPFQLTIHLSSFHSTLYSPSY
jgi:hypothetical protein